jgi:hypothetical protein
VSRLLHRVAARTCAQAIGLRCPTRNESCSCSAPRCWPMAIERSSFANFSNRDPIRTESTCMAVASRILPKSGNQFVAVNPRIPR